MSDDFPENLTATYFYSEHCIACAKVHPVVSGLPDEYPFVVVVEYNVWNSTANESLFFSFGEKYGSLYPRYPSVFLSDGTFFEGLGAISDDLPDHLSSAAAGPAEATTPALAGSPGPAPVPSSGSLAPGPSPSPSASLSSPPLPPVGAVIAAGLIDGVNPCAVAVLIFLLLALAGAGGRVQMLRSGAAYVAGIYLMYFISGFGILTAVRVTGLSFVFSCVAGVIAVLLGLVMVADSFRPPESGHFHISSSLLDSVRALTVRGGFWSAFFAGVVVSLIELPCTGGVYLAILAMLSGAEAYAAAGLLALYNLMFVLPLVVILAAAAAGFSPERMSGMRLEYRRALRFLGGFVLILLGLGVLLWFAG